MEPPASTEIGPEVTDVMRNVHEAMLPICSFHNDDFGELVDENELTHGGVCWSPWSSYSVTVDIIFGAIARMSILITRSFLSNTWMMR